MFCGLPISVAAEPILLAQARPSRKGTGSSRRRRQASASTGATARQTMSLENTADSTADTAITTPISAAGPTGRAAMRRVTAP